RGELELSLLAALGLLGNPPLRLQLYFEVAPGTAQLEEIECARAGDPVHRARVIATPGIAELGFGHYADIESSPVPGTSTVLSLTLPILGPLSVTASGDVAVDASPAELLFEGPFVPQIPEPSPQNTQTVD